MGQVSFARQAIRHKANLEKYNTAYLIADHSRRVLFLLLGASVYMVLAKGLLTGLIVLFLIEWGGLITLRILNDRLLMKINQSQEILAHSEKRMKKISEAWATPTDVKAEFTYSDHLYFGELDIFTGEMIRQQEITAGLCEDMDFSAQIEDIYSRNAVGYFSQLHNEEIEVRESPVKNSTIKFLLM